MADEDVTDAAVDTDANSSTDTAADTTDTTTPDVATDVTDKTAAEVQGDTTQDDVVPDWPDDWRDKLAKGDEKTRKRLDRFQSPADVLKSWQALEAKMSSGDVKESLPENATDEQLAAYRKANGIPDTPDGYLTSLPDGLVVGENDKPIFDTFTAGAHEKNFPPEFVGYAVDWYQRTQEEQIAEQVKSDKEFAQQYEDELRTEWGNEYRSNVNAVHSFLDTAPQADDGTPLKELLLGSRLSDGTPVGDHPAMLKWLARLASDANPAGFVAPGAGVGQIESVKSEIAEIEGFMRTNRAEYNKDTKMQERLRVLYDAEEKLSA